MFKNTIAHEAIVTIAQATDKELYGLEFRAFSLSRRIEEYKSYINKYKTGATVDRFLVQRKEAQAELAVVVAEVEKLNGVFKALGGWERYIIVPGGHIHNYGCTTLYATTQTVEAYMYSAEKVESLIEKAGDRACTVCFPDAPVNKPSTIEQFVKEREQREAEAKARAEKKAKAQSEAIVREDGKVAFKTLRALTNEISWQMGSYVGLAGYTANFGDIFGHGKIEMNPETPEEYRARFAPQMANYKKTIEGLVALAEANGHDVTEYVAKTFTKKIKEQIKECKKYPSGVVFPEGFTDKF
ncbi:hypothetical protein PBI_CANTARE_91 [Brevibacterium phage Cantare]|uniref:Uncharacterized protein n=1 Tax=Brevibacterium phage Cantare TaxID=2338395 RepID=A0A3G3LYW1_9CAUD|nr:hypothetical protein PQD70_gp091 [Brevibacterium phage Cantare]AYQ99311.1 hypothetical protein PBI_CANTARE_91 [Brevibacterium phage Cantare]